MNQFQQCILKLYGDAVCGRPVSDPEFSKEEWTDLFRFAHMHEILPLLYDSCFCFQSLKQVPAENRKAWKEHAISSAIRQIIQTNEFLTIIKHAQEQGLDPIVLKGIICRLLYPQPCLRPSVDEDLLISAEDATAFHTFLIAEGLSVDDPDADPLAASELSYHKENSPTYIELQKTLFDQESEVFGVLNELFDGVYDRTVRVLIEDVSVRTLAPTDHLLYLILHAFKHFVHSGIGIRAVCDVGLFAERYVTEIDWTHVRKCLEEVHAFDFACALFHIVKQYLLPDALSFGHIVDWKVEGIDTESLLDDIFAGGVHGNSSLERLHSSNITLQAVAQGQKGTHEVSSGYLSTAAHAIFLPFKEMTVYFPYLKKAPILLPVAWVQRLGKYLKERIDGRSGNRSSTAESLRLGRTRVELLKKYGIIK